MKNKLISVTGLLLLAAANLSLAQHINTLHDVDSVYEWGWNILLRPDGNYLVNGWGLNQTTGQPQLFNIKVSTDGQSILDKRALKVPSTSYSIGDPGQLKEITLSSYIAPVTVQRPRGTYVSSQGGIMKYDSDGDTVFIKTYTDTSIYFDLMYCSAVMPANGYLIGGSHSTNIPSYYPGLLMRTDTFGDTLWTHTYKKNSSQSVRIRSIIPLSDGRIVVGASSTYTYFIGSSAFYHHTPWFLVLDSDGNILKDTLYGAKYGLGGFIYKDIAGGYIHFGWIDTVAVPAFPNDLRNHPYYIAHLDTNFRIEWLTRFPHDDCNSRRSPWQIKQLRDSTFLILGDDYCNGCLCAPAYSGWAAKISRTGAILWNHNYWTDTNEVAYLRDMAERPDGSMVFTGSAFNDTLPSWHGGRDVWIFSTDSNGCVIPGCGDVTNVPDVPQKAAQTFALYPNPTTGSITLLVSGSGSFVISTIEGKTIDARKVVTGINDISLPAHLANGLYMGVYTPDDGTKPDIVRFVYQR
jgi:hypothetical protein